MARLPLVETDKLGQRLSKVLEAFKRAAPDFNPNVVRVMANNPELGAAFYDFYSNLRLQGRIDSRLKELVRLKIAELNDCRT